MLSEKGHVVLQNRRGIQIIYRPLSHTDVELKATSRTFARFATRGGDPGLQIPRLPGGDRRGGGRIRAFHFRHQSGTTILPVRKTDDKNTFEIISQPRAMNRHGPSRINSILPEKIIGFVFSRNARRHCDPVSKISLPSLSNPIIEVGYNIRCPVSKYGNTKNNPSILEK